MSLRPTCILNGVCVGGRMTLARLQFHTVEVSHDTGHLCSFGRLGQQRRLGEEVCRLPSSLACP